MNLIFDVIIENTNVLLFSDYFKFCRLYPQQYTQQLPHNNVNNTTSDISQKSLPCVPAVGTTTMTTLASSTSMANSFSGNESMTNTCTVNTTSSTNHELEKLLSPSTSTKND